MIIIADSGSTKVAWRILHKDGTVQAIQTIGINPFFVSEEDIYQTLENSLRPGIKGNVEQVFFYGAGVAGKDKIDILTRCFKRVFPGCEVEANSDLLAAARCVCGHEKGKLWPSWEREPIRVSTGRKLLITFPHAGTYWEMKAAVRYSAKNSSRII